MWCNLASYILATQWRASVGQIELKIEQLLLDHENPRISEAESQREALQNILTDQGNKLYALAESIVQVGLNPMDRFLGLKSVKDKKYIILEGNRRTAALKILANPHVLSNLEVKATLRKRLEDLAKEFDRSKVEPIPCVEVQSRDEGNYWIQLRHTGENEGRGIVGWSGLASSRFRGRSPALQALQLVLDHGKLSKDVLALIEERFPITTLERLLATPEVRKLLGLQIKDHKLVSLVPAEEVLKPLTHIVRDLAEKRINVTKLKTQAQQVKYVSDFEQEYTADLSKKQNAILVEEITILPKKSKIQAKLAAKKPTAQAERTTLVPKNCSVNVTDTRILEIYSELQRLKVAEFPNSVAVLLRVFLELSTDHYMEHNSIPTQINYDGKGGSRNVDKTLDTKIRDVLEHLVSHGGNKKKDFIGIERGLSAKDSPLWIDLLHAYVHNRFVTPSVKELITAWDNAQRFFEKIWL